jgi:hypothetical protein
VLFIVGIVVFNGKIMNLFSGTNLHEKFPYFLFILLSATLTVLAFVKKLSLIPVLGLVSCFYLMAELEYQSWIRFLAWLIIGLIIYFSYGYKHSVMGKGENAELER